MASDPAETAVNLIVEAYKQSEMTEQQFGALLELIALDFKQGKATKPERSN
ncbi:hypothetical protein [uncultured Roseibium sp.]|uniref:hypothetical protein n=1 Tax=uncultured Roseibium sp. TaxID=1936171 RepID=UPI002604829A|nr:hypothetical protein [uncultured Roseibium sp.]